MGTTASSRKKYSNGTVSITPATAPVAPDLARSASRPNDCMIACSPAVSTESRTTGAKAAMEAVWLKSPNVHWLRSGARTAVASIPAMPKSRAMERTSLAVAARDSLSGAMDISLTAVEDIPNCDVLCIIDSVLLNSDIRPVPEVPIQIAPSLALTTAHTMLRLCTDPNTPMAPKMRRVRAVCVRGVLSVATCADRVFLFRDALRNGGARGFHRLL